MNGEKKPRRKNRRGPSQKILHYFMAMGDAARQRFEAKIDREPVNSEGCLQWTGGKRKGGVGAFKIKNEEGKEVIVSAHRVAWTLHYNTEIPQGLIICHRCDNEWCINWEHLWLGRDQHNVFDAQIKGKRPHITREKKEEYAALYIGGMGWTEIKKRFSLAQSSVTHIFKDPCVIKKYGTDAISYKRMLKQGAISQEDHQKIINKYNNKNNNNNRSK